MSKFLVYAMIDPRNHEIRYIRKSCSGMDRPKAHMYPSNYNRLKTYQYSWIKKLLSLNLIPIIEVLEETEKEKLSATEMHYIRLAKEEGHCLTNLTMGGDGTTGRVVSQEVKDRMSRKYKGRKMPAETMRKMLMANTVVEFIQKKKKEKLVSLALKENQ